MVGYNITSRSPTTGSTWESRNVAVLGKFASIEQVIQSIESRYVDASMLGWNFLLTSLPDAIQQVLSVTTVVIKRDNSLVTPIVSVDSVAEVRVIVEHYAEELRLREYYEKESRVSDVMKRHVHLGHLVSRIIKTLAARELTAEEYMCLGSVSSSD